MARKSRKHPAPKLTLGLLTKYRYRAVKDKKGKEKDAVMASPHASYHPFEVQGRSGQEAVVLRCL